MSTLAINEHAREDLLKFNLCVRKFCRKSSFAVAIEVAISVSREFFSESTDRKWQKRWWWWEGVGVVEWKVEFWFYQLL